VPPQRTSDTETWDALFTDCYLRAYADDERTQAATAQALDAVRLAAVPAGGELLDVPCGFGRHTVALARDGRRVTGVDRSATLLEEARRRAGDLPVELVQADYRDLPFADGRFDAALNLFTSLGYLGDEEDTRVLQEIRRVLRPGGRLVVEILHRDALAIGFVEQEWRSAGAARLLLERRTFDVAAGLCQVTQTLVDPSAPRESRTYSMRVYTATELVAMARAAGFAEVRCFGGLDGAPLERTTRLVVLATA
jgi:ubiquinone/menaquinone biosynthesis C-methylase UbiE